MKNITKILLMLTMAAVLLCAQTAFAEPSEVLKGIFDSLLEEDSSYSKTKALYREYYPEIEYKETLDDDSFTITITGNEYTEGSWTYTQEGDYLTSAFASDDFSGAVRTSEVLDAVGRYFKMNTRLLNGYVIGLNALEIGNSCFIMEPDETGEHTSVRISIAGPYDMKELDQMVISSASFDASPLTSEHISTAGTIGKLKVIANGTVDDVTILLGEYGELDDLAYQSIMNVVAMLQPAGWEQFAAEYKELKDADTDAYSVTLNLDLAAAREIIQDASEEDSFVLVRFGK